MNHANLTARYRPQKFAELAGQETVKAILSRAAAEDKVAAAYLFSGTRGVGKTTVARIFAKALNCVQAPGPEPCNQCERCRQIILGTAVDVVEIDGASNRGIDDVRKLKEVVGYAPMEGRYKVFIIDEAHMLSRDAFNALLKTLEEPPGNVTFILATTEPHKFPATIISRCQHYVFKGLSEQGLEAHLVSVLSRENCAYEELAVRLIARRAAGSVRDAMSLLGQVLALGGESLTEADTRNVLGLAGQELFFTMFRIVRGGDSVALIRLIGEMLNSGLDIGFFLREMASCWRNMFILRQAGEKALAVLEIPEAEAGRWQQEAEGFDLAHIHAAWQMTIDGQRRVLTSLEPALALELLLLNIAMLPQLLPLEQLGRLTRSASAAPPTSGGDVGAPSPPSSTPVPARGGASGVTKAAPRLEVDISREQATGDAPDMMPTETLPMPVPSASGMGYGAPCALSRSDYSWEAFLRFCKQREGLPAFFSGMLLTVKGEWEGKRLSLTPSNEFCAGQLRAPDANKLFLELVHEYYGKGAEIVMLPPPHMKSPAEIKEELRENPVVKLLEKEMGARLVDYGVSRNVAAEPAVPTVGKTLDTEPHGSALATGMDAPVQ